MSFVVRAHFQLIENPLFDYTYLEENADELLYLQSLPIEDDSKAIGSTHFYFVRKIGDTYYSVKSYALGDYTGARAKDMLRAAKSLKKADAV